MGDLIILPSKTKKEKVSFNTVIEGSYPSPWKQMFFKLTSLDIPQHTAVITDGVYSFDLCWTTENFNDLESTQEVDGLETKVNYLPFCEGIVIPRRKNSPYDGTSLEEPLFLLDRPRTICLNDGRIFVDPEMLSMQGYDDAIPYIVGIAGRLFDEQSFQKAYQKAQNSEKYWAIK
ncbi:hypothetical protein GOV04_02730 [Candidatus Woesearchaeota archaeon]|nr:hypothetical protein [Candidatus Woesearchaeota archaeon]